MRQFNYTEADLINNNYTDGFYQLMKYEGDRARGYFRKANESLNFEDKPSLFAARAMQHIYYKLLNRLEEKKYDIFNNDINVPKFEKVAIAFGVWAKYSLVY